MAVFATNRTRDRFIGETAFSSILAILSKTVPFRDKTLIDVDLRDDTSPRGDTTSSFISPSGMLVRCGLLAAWTRKTVQRCVMDGASRRLVALNT